MEETNCLLALWFSTEVQKKTSWSFKNETIVQTDAAWDDYSGVKEKRQTDQQQTEKGVQGPEEGAQMKEQCLVTEKSPF